jgi:hypothetical protein
VDKKRAAARLVATPNLATRCMTLKINFDSATSVIFSGITSSVFILASMLRFW